MKLSFREIKQPLKKLVYESIFWLNGIELCHIIIFRNVLNIVKIAIKWNFHTPNTKLGHGKQIVQV